MAKATVELDVTIEKAGAGVVHGFRIRDHAQLAALSARVQAGYSGYLKPLLMPVIVLVVSVLDLFFGTQSIHNERYRDPVSFPFGADTTPRRLAQACPEVMPLFRITRRGSPLPPEWTASIRGS